MQVAAQEDLHVLQMVARQVKYEIPGHILDKYSLSVRYLDTLPIDSPISLEPNQTSRKAQY